MKKRILAVLLVCLLLTGCFGNKDLSESKTTTKTTNAKDVLVITVDKNKKTSKRRTSTTTKNTSSTDEIIYQRTNSSTTTVSTTTSSTTPQFNTLPTGSTTKKTTTTKKTSTTTKKTSSTTKTTKSTTKSTTKTTTKQSSANNPPIVAACEKECTTLTESCVKNVITCFENKTGYKHGTIWTNSVEYIWQASNRPNYYGYGCVAFAYKLSDAAFGTRPATKITDVKNYKVKVGDIIRFDEGTSHEHSSMILEVKSDTLVLTEANVRVDGGEGQVYWRRTISKTDRSNWSYVYTRYE